MNNRFNNFEKKSNTENNDQFIARKMKYQNSLMINICDIELLGKNINENNVNINISPKFFNERINKQEIKELLTNCSIANLIGVKIVEMALKSGLAKKESVKIISDVPFLMIFKFQENY
ncbi:MAG: DUF424 family protein [Nitrososphaeraceae archaeon]